MSTQTPVDTYEARYARLQEVVAQLEMGELSLDRTIALYEEGVVLAAECQALLDAAELRVQQLQSGETAIDLEA
ncbi:exodeoxyribonuclease VII small subunit [Oscillochloris sp. ZM17-4]|uniref:exodeoxyribonuclease VII small subunit n=1 Tax=Oscillochloris sp. ZM17-4 TaxID=2866714 RepID=UPI001C72B859|nr:exodeoxyribonuclease VII small subunit [Oscillochloris sp. ZM17-4]MBX0328317.1 exodeoxyribonuclease VII small subunit [Oscillochloris sp. ZM17-4]